jgi:DNA-binding response OmpR family regulator
LGETVKAYLLADKKAKLDRDLEGKLKILEFELEKVDLPEDHEEVYEFFQEKEGGLIFIPAVWQDLFCVKVVQEIVRLRGSFEAIIVGSNPKMTDLIVAFNNGLSAYLTTPIDTQELKQVITRASSKLNEKSDKDLLAIRLAQYESSGKVQSLFSQTNERDLFLAKAFVDLFKQKGPIIFGETHVLLVGSSGAQKKKLETFLKQIGMHIDTAVDIKSGVDITLKGKYQLIISDNVLPDGSAIEMITELRAKVKGELPRFIVWSSSPEKYAELINPETHIDDVIIKPGPGTGIEMVLPSVIAAIYSSET